MKKHNILKVVLLSIMVTAICTWVFPTAQFQSSLVISKRNPVGVFDLFGYVVEVILNFPQLIVMFLATGMFYGVAYKIPAYRVLLDNIVKKFNGHEPIFLAVIMILIAGILSLTGLSFGILFVFPFVISVILLMGYNKLVAASVVLGSTVVGILGTILGPNVTSFITYYLGLDVFSEMTTKIVILVASLVILIYNVLAYAKKTKNNTDKVLELVPASIASTKEKVEVKVQEKAKEKKDDKKAPKKKETVKKESSKKESTKKKADSKKTESKTTASKSSTDKKKPTKSTTKTSSAKKTTKKTTAYDLKSKVETKVTVKPKKKVKTWPFILIFDLIVLVLAISTFDWEGTFGITFFTDALEAIQKFAIADIEIFDKLLGSVNQFGRWSLYFEIPVFICLATCFLGFIYGLKMDDFFDGVIAGIKKAMKPMIYMIFAYMVVVIAVYNPFQLNFTKFILGLTKEFNVITMTLATMVSSLFHVENIYAIQTTLPYAISFVDATVYPLVAVIFQAISGLVMLVAPTSAILLGTLSYLDISYGQWLKHIWKVFLELLVVLVVIFFIVFLI